MADIIRDSPLGQIIRFITSNKVLQYPEERPEFILPIQFTNPSDSSIEKTQSRTHDNEILEAQQNTSSSSSIQSSKAQDQDIENIPTAEPTTITPQITADGTILVDWYTKDDPDNPQNWSYRKRNLVALVICIYTFVVYAGSAIYVASELEVSQKFNVNAVQASLPLSLYVLAYGAGPLLFSPLSEIPSIGRSPIYFVTIILFTILSVPTALVDNFAGLLVLRFLQGFFGSPCLATGAATMQDMYPFIYMPYALTGWVFSAYGGPALGPLLSGFAVSAKGWRWSLWEIVWMAGPVLILMTLLLPETLPENILHRRAARLRNLTGNPKIQSQSEIDQRHMTATTILVEACIKPIEICIKDPAICFVNLYTALVYGIYYSFFEVFPIVYLEIHRFNLGMLGTVFVVVEIGAIAGAVSYCLYVYWYLIPDIRKHGARSFEHRLVPAVFASLGPPVGLFLFAWTSKASIHWIAPTIGIGLYAFSVFIILQCIFVYIPLSYPKYAASLFAGNDFVRSAMACGSILYGRPLFINLGVGKGVSVLGGLSVTGIAGMWAIWHWGAYLRSKSKFAGQGKPHIVE